MKLLLVLAFLIAQPDSLTLENCLREARNNFPGLVERGARAAIADLNTKNLDAHFLPGVSLRSRVSFQSDVAEIPVDVPGFNIPAISRDQYKAALAIEQLVFDGGATSAQKKLEALQVEMSDKRIEVDLHAIKKRVLDAYFGALVSDAGLESLQALKQDLDARLAIIQSRVRQGILTSETADVLAVELLRLDQRKTEIVAARQTAIAALAELTTLALAPDVPLQVPLPNDHSTRVDISRPEQDVFASSKDMLVVQEKMASIPYRPQVAGFAEAAYGRPVGMNFFSDEFGFFYSAGISLNWRLWDWKQVRRQRESMRLEREILDSKEERFLQGIRIESTAAEQDIQRLASQLEQDIEIIALRQRISEVARSKLENGTITATEYLIERNAEEQAVLQQQMHRLEWIFAQLRLKQIRGLS